ncbi:tyrosine--tRNA ligase [Chitinibacter sp. S2-10]|uniref:tyrosine--tRNA ligase n=1 Tax=Chitinibacter sp. S2-10 TaxID=3373597 RepID=UPI00397791F8
MSSISLSQANLIEELQARGLVAQCTDQAALSELLAKESVTLYCGFDPTADSLHIGSLVPILVLKRFQQYGHKPIALVGGATGMIGDPSFKATERKLNTPDVIASWVDKIRKQVEPFLNFDGDNAAIMSNNYDWFGGMGALEFLRDIGKYFSVNVMIKKEAVQQRIAREDQGISYTEFSYSLLQGYDFTELNKRYDCKLQIGGSDQWGNITAGTDLTRRLNQTHVFGLTLPLVTKADGSKFGKTETGTIWLDAKKTSPYAFYQFWLNSADADVYKFLKYFSFLSIAEIDAIEEADKTSGKKPEAQRILAEQVTALVHGATAVEAAQRISQHLFSDSLAALTQNDFEQLAQDGMPSVQIEKSVANLIDALVAGGLAKSKTEARTFIQSGAVIVNGQKVESLDYTFSDADRLFDAYTLLRRGKKNYVLLCWK